MKINTDRVLLILILAVLVLIFFWERPTPTQVKTEYIPGKSDTTIVNVKVTFPDIYMPEVQVSYHAPVDSAKGILPSNCDSFRVTQTKHYDSLSGSWVTVEDSVHGKLLKQKVSLDLSQLHIKRVDTIKITNEIVKKYVGPYLGLGLDSGIVNLQLGASYVGKKGVWTGFYKTNDKSINIGRTFLLK